MKLQILPFCQQPKSKSLFLMQPIIERSTKESPIVINIAEYPIPLPQGATITPYETQHKKKLDKDSYKKKKYKSFSYYRVKPTPPSVQPQILKILFLDSENYILISKHPFIFQTYTKHKFQQLNDLNPERLTICESLLIGDRKNLDEIILRKLHLCKVTQEDGEVDTIKDDFQALPINNPLRYKKMVEHLKATRKEGKNPCMKVMVGEDGEQARVLDFDFFFAEKKCAERFSGKVGNTGEGKKQK